MKPDHFLANHRYPARQLLTETLEPARVLVRHRLPNTEILALPSRLW